LQRSASLALLQRSSVFSCRSVAQHLSSLLAAIKKLNFASNSISTVAAGSFPGQFSTTNFFFTF
jgi:hypothetical protein